MILKIYTILLSIFNLPILFLLFFIPNLLYSQGATLLKNDGVLSYNIYYYNTEKNLEFEKIENTARWTNTKSPELNFNKSEIYSWIRIDVKNHSDRDDWILVIDYPLLEDIKFYYPNQDGYSIVQTGSAFSPQNREIYSRAFAFYMRLPLQQTNRYYLRVWTFSENYIPIKILTSEEFFKSSLVQSVILGILNGMLLIAIFYSSYLFLSIINIDYLIFIVYSIFTILYLTFYTGLSSQILFSKFHNYHFQLFVMFKSMVIVGILWLALRFLNIKRISAILYKSILLLITTNILLVLLSVFFASSFIYGVIHVLFYIILIGVSALSLYFLINGYTPAVYFLFSWLSILISQLILDFTRKGIIHKIQFNGNIILLGFVISNFFILISFMDKMRFQKDSSNKKEIGLLDYDSGMV